RLLPTADVSPPATISSSPPLPPLPPLSTLFPYTTLFRSPLIAREQLDLVVANAENAANGSGRTPRGYRQLRQAGVDLITMGDHVYKKLDVLAVFEKEDRICRPANYPPDAPGREFVRAAARDGTAVAAFGVLGRTFMRPV